MIARLASLALRLGACALLACAVALMLLTLALVSSQVALALHATPLALSLTRALPAWFAYWGVVASPLGGVFRTDLFVLALLACGAARLLTGAAKGVR